jgi:predicted DNA-binding transcriptional regulator YafY
MPYNSGMNPFEQGAIVGKSMEEKVRGNRILMIDEAIRGGSYPSISKLARLAEVTKRTIERDIECLRDMYRAPIEYDYQRRGYYYSEPNFFIRPLRSRAPRGRI